MNSPNQKWLDIGYDTALWIFNIMLEVFFREIRPRGAHKIPKSGPVIFVAAPHANQVKDKRESQVNSPFHSLVDSLSTHLLLCENVIDAYRFLLLPNP